LQNPPLFENLGGFVFDRYAQSFPVNSYFWAPLNQNKIMNRVLIFIFCVGFLNVSLFGQVKTHSFKLEKSEFLLDGKPFQMISGEIHPARIPAEY